MYIKHWTKVRKEEEGTGDGGSGTEISPFLQFAKEQGEAPKDGDAGDGSGEGKISRGGPDLLPVESILRTEDPTPAKPDAKPSASDEPVDMASALLGVLKKPSSAKPTPQKPADIDPLTELVGELPPPPTEKDGTAAQFEYVKTVQGIFKDKLLEIGAEMKSLKGKGMTNDERERVKQLEKDAADLKAERDAWVAEKDAMAKRLATYDLQEDPEFQRQYVQPVAEKERELLELVNIVGRDNPNGLRQECTAALSMAQDKDFRAAVNEIADQIGGHDGADLRRELFGLRKLYIEQLRAKNDLQNTVVNVEKSKHDRGKLLSRKFIDTEIGDALQEFRDADPLAALMYTDDIVKAMAPHKVSLKQADDTINSVVEDEITRRGGMSQEMGRVVAMAKLRVRERVAFQNMLSVHEKQTKELAELRAQYRRATGADFKSSPSGADQGSRDSNDRPVGLVEFAKSRKMI